MIEFEEIDSRLKSIGKNREWLAQVTGRSSGAIRSALAKNADKKHRSALLRQALSDAIEKEEERGSPSPESTQLPDRITVEVDPARMNHYLEAADHARQNLKVWTIKELDRAAAAWLKEKQQKNLSVVAEEPAEPKAAPQETAPTKRPPGRYPAGRKAN